jgi:uncharacterized protein (TIGR00255 family)
MFAAGKESPLMTLPEAGLQSMTGFARQTGVTDLQNWVWELKSVNARGLDVRVRVPPGLDLVGDEARKRLLGAFSRGTINATLTMSRAGTVPRPRINAEALHTLVASLAAGDLPDGIGPLSFDGLLAVRGVVEISEDAGLAPEAMAAPLLAGLDLATGSLKAARLAEGKALAAVLARQTKSIAELTEAAECHPARTPDAIKARLAEQVAALMASANGLDQARLHQEAAILAVKSDIREELDRLKAHIEALKILLATQGPVGRKLDFLAQEFGREASTLCAKANDVTLSRIGLDLRTVVDQLREQVQNVE